MKKIVLVLFTMFVVCAFAGAQEVTEEQNEVSAEQTSSEESQKPFQNHILTLAGFNALQVEEEDFILTPSLNLQYMRIKNKGVESKQPDAIVIGAGYSWDHFTTGLGPDKIDNFHGINLMGNISAGKNSFTAMVASSGEVPFSSFKTITAGLMYTRQIVQTDNISFVFGGGIMAGDFGLKIKDFNIYVIPLPLFSFNYQNDVFAGGISVMGLPSVSLALFPKSMFRLKGSCGMAGFKSVRDVTFDAALVCYPLWYTELKEMVSVSAGVQNKVAGYTLKDKTSYGYQYYSVYGEINATLVSIRAGYNFDGKKRYEGDEVGDMYKGMFATVQAMYMF